MMFLGIIRLNVILHKDGKQYKIRRPNNSKRKKTWENLLQLEKNRYFIFIFSHQLRGTIKYSLDVVWIEDTIHKQNQTKKDFENILEKIIEKSLPRENTIKCT